MAAHWQPSLRLASLLTCWNTSWCRYIIHYVRRCLLPVIVVFAGILVVSLTGTSTATAVGGSESTVTVTASSANLDASASASASTGTCAAYRPPHKYRQTPSSSSASTTTSFSGAANAPVLLLSFPGSGNTWSRLLLEHATGYLTGSIYNDISLATALHGESICDVRTIAVKGHTGDFYLDSSMGHGLHLKVTDLAYRSACAAGGVRSFQRVILLVRDPYAAILSEYQRVSTNDHAALVHLNDSRSRLAWYFSAVDLSNTLETETKALIRPLLQSTNLTTSTKQVLVIRYEDLRNKLTRIATLRSMTEFLSNADSPSTERLKCAFALSEHPSIHRKARTLEDRLRAYNIHPTMVCDIWQKVRGFSELFGYSVYNHTQCSAASKSLLTGEGSSCPADKYTNTKYIPFEIVKAGHKPLLLLSFPGSGNTWSRLLLEYASGYFTGSLYNDTNFTHTIRSENTCGLRFLAIKGYAHDFEIAKYFTAEDVGTMNISQINLRFRHKPLRNKCRKGVVYGFHRLVILMRDPFVAIISHYLERFGFTSSKFIPAQHRSGSNSSNLSPLAEIDVGDWANWALTASKLMKERTTNLLLPLKDHYFDKHNIMIARYEDLLDPAKRQRTLQSIVTFAGLVDDVSPDRFRCAFELALEQQSPGYLWTLRDNQTRTDYGRVMEVFKAAGEKGCAVRQNIFELAQHFGYNLTNAYFPAFCPSIIMK